MVCVTGHVVIYEVMISVTTTSCVVAEVVEEAPEPDAEVIDAGLSGVAAELSGIVAEPSEIVAVLEARIS